MAGICFTLNLVFLKTKSDVNMFHGKCTSSDWDTYIILWHRKCKHGGKETDAHRLCFSNIFINKHSFFFVQGVLVTNIFLVLACIAHCSVKDDAPNATPCDARVAYLQRKLRLVEVEVVLRRVFENKSLE